MKKVLLLALLALAPNRAADDVSRRKESMDRAQEWKDDLKDALDAKARTKSVELAEKLAKAGAEEAAYWKSAKQDDISKLATDNLEAARRIVLSAKAGKFDQALRAYDRLEITCRACHDLHPEKRQK